MLRRFADTRLRADLARETQAKENAIRLARAIALRLRAARAEAATNKALMERWRGIARQAQEQLAAERARTQETTR